MKTSRALKASRSLREGFAKASRRLQPYPRRLLEGFAKAPRAPPFGNDSSDNTSPHNNNSSATSALAHPSTPRPTNPQSVQYSTHLLLLQSSVFPALCTAVYAAVVEQCASNPEVDGAFCGRPRHPLHTQAICGGGDRSRLLTLGTTEPFACRCPNVNKMLQMCEKKSQSVIQLAHTFGGQISSNFKKKTTTNASLRLYQIMICRKKRQKKVCLKRPLL